VFGWAVGLFVVGGAGNGIGNVARRSLIHHRRRTVSAAVSSP